MSRIPDFLLSLEKMKEVHESKNKDYASDSNPFSNFDASEYGLKMFPNPRDGAFVWPIFTKLARLSTLLNSGKVPNNESIEDSFIDIANYILLWKADFLNRSPIVDKYDYQCRRCGNKYIGQPVKLQVDPLSVLFFCSNECKSDWQLRS